jgi:hypothetical protein
MGQRAISPNAITYWLPQSFNRLTALEKFWFYDNEIKVTDLKYLFDSLVNLKSFTLVEYLGINSSEIPESIGKLTKLESIYLWSNTISKIPASMKSLKRLKYIEFLGMHLKDDMFDHLPDSLIALDLQRNKLTFAGLEPYIKRAYFLRDEVIMGGLNYIPQQPIPVIKNDDKLTVAAGGTPANNTYKWYKQNGTLLQTKVGDSIFRPAEPGNYYAEVTNTVASGLVLTSETASAVSAQAKACVGGGSFTIPAGQTGTTYLWQMSTDSVVYTNLAEGGQYTGTQTPTLTVNHLPAQGLGYRFRCLVNGNSSIFYTIKPSNTWLGAQGNAWENATNWSCGSVPNDKTAVVISSGIVVINSNVVVKSISVSPGASLTVSTGFTLQVIEQ